MRMSTNERLVEKISKKIISLKGKSFEENPFYWFSQLDYSRDDSHPEHNILREKILHDLKIVDNAKEILKKYKKIGIDLEE